MIFGSNRDFGLLTHIGRELLHDVVEQEILYYKFSLDDTEANLYGEALEKSFWNAVKLNCLIIRGDNVTTDDEFGPDSNRESTFSFIRQDLVDVNIVPEVGDIIMWHENYFEVDNVNENQLFLGRDSDYNLTQYGSQFGSSVSIVVKCHLTRADKLGITEVGY